MCFSSEEDKRGKLDELRAAAVVEALIDSPIADVSFFPEALCELAHCVSLPLDVLAEAIPIGASIDSVVDRFLYWLLSVELQQYPTSAPVAELYRRRLTGDEPGAEEWKKAAAVDARLGPAHAAAANAAAYVADAADAVDARLGPAHAAAANAAYAAAAAYKRYRDQLLTICRGEAP